MFRKSEIINKLDKIEKSINSVKQECYDCKNTYKILKDFIEELLENKLLENKNTIHTISENIKNNNNTQYINETKIISKIEDISQKLDSLYLDNETIKHQLFLENELKKSIQDIENLSITIHSTIELINYTIYKIDKIDKTDKIDKYI
jgi:hypothetical protein